MIYPAFILFAQTLVIQSARRQDIFTVQNTGDSGIALPGGSQLKYPAHHRGGFLINHKAVLILRAAQITVGRVGAHKHTVFRTGSLYRLNLFAGIPAVKFIKQVQKAHYIIAAIAVLRINAVV